MTFLGDKYVFELRPADVLFGRGSGPNDHEGNIRFRQLVAERKGEYMATNHRVTKAMIAREIVDQVFRINGRFMRKLDPQEIRALGLPLPEGADVYEVVDDETIMEKAKQALRQNTQKLVRSSLSPKPRGKTAVVDGALPVRGGPPIDITSYDDLEPLPLGSDARKPPQPQLAGPPEQPLPSLQGSGWQGSANRNNVHTNNGPPIAVEFRRGRSPPRPAPMQGPTANGSNTTQQQHQQQHLFRSGGRDRGVPEVIQSYTTTAQNTRTAPHNVAEPDSMLSYVVPNHQRHHQQQQQPHDDDAEDSMLAYVRNHNCPPDDSMLAYVKNQDTEDSMLAYVRTNLFQRNDSYDMDPFSHDAQPLMNMMQVPGHAQQDRRGSMSMEDLERLHSRRHSIDRKEVNELLDSFSKLGTASEEERQNNRIYDQEMQTSSETMGTIDQLPQGSLTDMSIGTIGSTFSVSKGNETISDMDEKIARIEAEVALELQGEDNKKRPHGSSVSTFGTFQPMSISDVWGSRRRSSTFSSLFNSRETLDFGSNRNLATDFLFYGSRTGQSGDGGPPVFVGMEGIGETGSASAYNKTGYTPNARDQSLSQQQQQQQQQQHLQYVEEEAPYQGDDRFFE